METVQIAGIRRIENVELTEENVALEYALRSPGRFQLYVEKRLQGKISDSDIDLLKYVYRMLRRYKERHVYNVSVNGEIATLAIVYVTGKSRRFETWTYHTAVFVRDSDGLVYIVLDRYTDSSYSYRAVAHRVIDNIFNYTHEVASRESYIRVKDARIRVQGDFVIGIRQRSEKDVIDMMKMNILQVIHREVLRDLAMWLSRRLSELRIAHNIGVSDVEMAIRVTIDVKRGRSLPRPLLEEFIKRLLPLKDDDYSLSIGERSPFGDDRDVYIITIRLNTWFTRELYGSLAEEIAYELLDTVKDYRVYVSNHTVELAGIERFVAKEIEMPFTSRTVRVALDVLPNNLYILPPGRHVVKVTHNEHGENTITIDTNEYAVVSLETLEKSRFHESIRNRIAISKLLLNH